MSSNFIEFVSSDSFSVETLDFSVYIISLQVVTVLLLCAVYTFWGFPGGSDGKASVCNAGDLGSIPRSGKSPGEGNGNPLQDSCLENSMDREAW